MPRSGTPDGSSHHKSSPQVEISASVLITLFNLAATNKGPAQSQVVNIARKTKHNAKLLVDVKTALILLEYSEGRYKSCSRPHCEELLTLSEAISGRVACMDHRDIAKLGSRAARLKKKNMIRGIGNASVRD